MADLSLMTLGSQGSALVSDDDNNCMCMSGYPWDNQGIANVIRFCVQTWLAQEHTFYFTRRRNSFV